MKWVIGIVVLLLIAACSPEPVRFPVQDAPQPAVQEVTQPTTPDPVKNIPVKPPVPPKPVDPLKTAEPTIVAPPTIPIKDPEPLAPGEERTGFHYQLQDVTFSNLKTVNTKYFIVDIDDASLSREELKALQDQEKIILSYLSIGEAEDYRSYWQSNWKPGNPSFIDQVNPDWEGNYKVKYWDPVWQQMMVNQINKIARAGYDGAYLDIVDAYYYFEQRGQKDSAEDMIDFIQKLRFAGRQVNQKFLIVPQNAVDLYDYTKYKAVIDGFGKEDTWFNDDNVQSSDETKYVLKFLKRARGDGKFVLAIDYPTSNNNICEFYRECRRLQFECTVSNRDLDLNQPIVC